LTWAWSGRAQRCTTAQVELHGRKKEEHGGGHARTMRMRQDVNLAALLRYQEAQARLSNSTPKQAGRSHRDQCRQEHCTCQFIARLPSP
jgi:hypothetical protein